ncbi:hypothetical protein ACLKA7_003634 [Drosophila subpalustris]
MNKAEYNPVLTRANRLELFTTEECEKILKTVLQDENKTGTLKEFKIVPAIEQTGFLGEYYHLILSYQLENESEESSKRLFVKSVVYQNADESFRDEKTMILKKEAMLYETLINELKLFSQHLWCAKCYFTRHDLFVMQNIEDLGYVSLPSETSFLSEGQLRPIFKALATLHASSVAFERSHRVTIGVKFREWLDEKSINADVPWCTTGINAILAVAATHPLVRDDAAAQEYIKNELPRTLDRVYYIVNSSAVHRNVFLHRDAWSANVFYHKDRPEDVGCVLVDFQLCRYAPPAVDFLMASYMNVEPKDRKEMQQRNISYYHDNLVSELKAMGIDPEKEQLSRSDFERSLEDLELFGATFNCISATVIRLPENYLKKLKDENPGEFHRKQTSMEQLLSSEECLLIALRTLQLKEDDDNLVLLDWQLVAGSKDLMGYMGEYYKLHLQVEHSEIKLKEHLQYFVKSLPYKNAPQRAECERKGVFRKEATIYKEILPNVQRYASRKLYPKCYYSRNDIMVLEDLTQHYRHLKPTETYTLKHYELVLEHLAVLHAASIAWEHQEQFNIGERYENVLIELFLSMQNEWFITGLKGIVFLARRHPKYQTETAQKFIKEKLYQLLSNSEELVKPSRTIRNVLCHRDTWDRNVFFGFANPKDSLPSSCCIVDFQLTKYCSPLLDVLFLLYIIPSASRRREIYDHCIEHYYLSLQSEFLRHGLSPSLISRDNFMEECQRSRLVALIKWALTEPQTKVSAEITNRMRAEEPDKFDYYLNSDRSEFYLRVMELQPGYEEKIMVPIEELVDYLMEHENLYA